MLKNYWTSASWCNEDCLRTKEEMLKEYGESTCQDCERQDNCEFCENGGESCDVEWCKMCINYHNPLVEEK